jgi:hypothetical protein
MKIRSSIGESGSSGIPAPNQRRFIVPNADSEQGVQMIDPSVVAGMRRQAQEQQEQVDRRSLDAAMGRIEILTGLGRKTKDVTIDDGTVFTLRSLKKFEKNCVAQVIEKAEIITMPSGEMNFSQTSLHKIQTEALSHSIFMVDGQSIDIVLGTANLGYEDKVVARKELVEEMDGSLIDYLWLQYSILNKETTDGYFPKTAEEAKEVVEAISKSGEDA